MRLPALNPNTLEANGITFEASDYFNPNINNYYGCDAPNADALEGRITISNTIKIEKAILATVPINEIFKSIAARFGASHETTLYLPLYEAVYSMLPEDRKYLIFNTYFRPVQELPRDNARNQRVYKFEICFVTLSGISYYESSRTITYLTLSCNLTSDTGAVFTEAQKETLAAALANPGATDVIVQNYNARMGKSVYIGDRIVPFIVGRLYEYATNNFCYSPVLDYEEYDIEPDRYTPHAIKTHLEQGVVLEFSFVTPFDRVGYIQRTSGDERRKFFKVLSYSTNVLEKLPYTIKGPNEAFPTLYGVELEANSEYTPRQVIEAQKDMFFLLKHDSSIHGMYSQCYEMVTIPCSLKAHKRLWAEFFEKMDYRKFDTTKDTGNGMHVHIGMETFKKKGHLNKFTWFFINPVNSDFIFLMSERANKNDLSRWAAITQVSQNPGKYHSTSRVAEQLNRGRGAVHYKGPTVEVRIFKGIVSYATIVKNLEFVDSVVKFTDEVSLSQVTLENYLSWLSKTPKNKYELLKTYLAEFKMSNYVDSAKLDTHLWGIRDDNSITEKLNAAPFKVTNAHLTVLNKRKRKRTYILKDGKVVCLSKNGGVLAKLDMLAQKKQTRGAITLVSNDF